MANLQHITLLALPSSLASSISLPLEILNAANEHLRTKNRRHPALSIHIVSDKIGSVTTAGGLSIMADATPSMIEQTDLLILPALWRNPVTTLKQYPTLLPWLAQLAAQQSIICAAGSSSYFLAEAGLLEHQAATTHWYYCDHFAQRYPNVKLKRQHLITQADNLYCAGSVNSIADLMVHLIGRHYGQGIARHAESQFSPEIRRPFAEHAYAQPESSPHQDETIIEAQEWLRENFQQSITIEQLAQQVNLSNRSLNRRFKQALGITGNEYLQTVRIDNAKELLRTSNISISEVADQSGFQDSSYFCARFKQTMGQTPLAYRKAVRGKLFQVI